MADVKGTVRRRVCVIGAGAAGLCALRHLARDPDNFEPAAFEQSYQIGGTWVYTEKTGLDDHGYPIHSSMYDGLRTNGPVKVMNFQDYTTLGQNSDASCSSHEDVLNYLKDYANHFKLHQYIQFNTRVECVRPVEDTTDWKKTTWKVRVKDVITKSTEEKVFDAVMVCNGHYFDPYIPNIPGIEKFTGVVDHSHNYRKPEKYAGKRVIVLGAASSGVDISIELTAVASHVYLSHNRDRMEDTLPSNMTQVAGVESFNGTEFVLRDGTTLTADSFMFCTGYKFVYSILHESCGIRVDDNYVHPLYKHMLNIRHPSMSIIGIPMSVIPFSIFHMQVQYHLAVLKGVATLPTKAEMLEDSKPKASKKRHAHVFFVKQFDYNDELAIAGKFEKQPPYYRNAFIAWNEAKKGNVLTYKNSKFFIEPDRINVRIVNADPKES